MGIPKKDAWRTRAALDDRSEQGRFQVESPKTSGDYMDQLPLRSLPRFSVPLLLRPQPGLSLSLTRSVRSHPAQMGRRTHVRMDDALASPRARLRGTYRLLRSHDPRRSGKSLAQANCSRMSFQTDSEKEMAVHVDGAERRGQPSLLQAFERPAEDEGLLFDRRFDGRAPLK